MFCGNCGANTTAEQKFCRVCGTRLLDASGSDFSPVTESGSSNKFFLAVEVVIDAFSRGIRYFFSVDTGGLEGSPRARFTKWGFLFFWAGIAAAFLGREGGIIFYVVGIILMFYARMGQASTAQSPRYEPRSLGTKSSAATTAWPIGSREPERERVARQPPFPGQFAETSTVKLTEGAGPPAPEAK